MNSKEYRIGELCLLFIALPLSFFWSYPFLIKGILSVVGFVYVLVILKKSGLLLLKLPPKPSWKPFLKTTLWKLFGIVIITSIYVYVVAPDKLFRVVMEEPLLWIAILFVYTFVSVWPQELIYRTFFFDRYSYLTKHKWVFMFLNALLFSLAHVFLKNILVQVLTFVGGLLFAYTYYKKQSTTLVSVEHAIYGNWLFTVGMGEMLAFPA